MLLFAIWFYSRSAAYFENLGKKVKKSRLFNFNAISFFSAVAVLSRSPKAASRLSSSMHPFLTCGRIWDRAPSLRRDIAYLNYECSSGSVGAFSRSCRRKLGKVSQFPSYLSGSRILVGCGWSRACGSMKVIILLRLVIVACSYAKSSPKINISWT